MAAEIKKIDGKTCVSTSLLCEAFGITRQALNNWSKRGCPKAARGYWCLPDVMAWREGDAKNSTNGSEVEKLPLTMQKIYWEARCREEQAQNATFQNAVLRGDYLEKVTAQKELHSFFITFKQTALSLPRKAAITAAQYIGNDRARHLENEMKEVVEDVLAQWSAGEVDADSGMDSRSASGIKAAGKHKRQSVGRQKPAVGSKDKQ